MAGRLRVGSSGTRRQGCAAHCLPWCAVRTREALAILKRLAAIIKGKWFVIPPQWQSSHCGGLVTPGLWHTNNERDLFDTVEHLRTNREQNVNEQKKNKRWTKGERTKREQTGNKSWTEQKVNESGTKREQEQNGNKSWTNHERDIYVTVRCLAATVIFISQVLPKCNCCRNATVCGRNVTVA
jgi:hypothetical protein